MSGDETLSDHFERCRLQTTGHAARMNSASLASTEQKDRWVQQVVDILLERSETPQKLSVSSYRKAHESNTRWFCDMSQVQEATLRVDPDGRIFRPVDKCWEGWKRIMRYVTDKLGMENIRIIDGRVAALDVFDMSEVSHLAKFLPYAEIFVSRCH